VIQVQVQLFSFLRDCLPRDAEGDRATITLPENAALSDLVRHLGIDRHLGHKSVDAVVKAGWQIMVSGQFELNMSRMLQDGDEIRIFPPIAGG
jgi:molybdopterin converting factor small subunit